MPLTIDEAVRQLRRDPKYVALVRDAYLDEDTKACAERFKNSAEFQETVRLLGSHAAGIVLDLGAGTGIASYAFACGNAKLVYALEPDPSDVVGRAAIARITQGMKVEMLAAHGERIPLSDASVDVVYTRQVLHHASDLPQLVKDCARVLRSDGRFFACREHVVDDKDQLQTFLQNHPIHQLAGGEHAYPLPSYLGAIKRSGLILDRVFGPWDTIINAFPSVRTTEDLSRYPQTLLESRFGKWGARVGGFGMVRCLIWKRLNRSVPGRLFAFLAHKP